jgi:ABC-2 type transport system ATP-binding protein
MRRGSVAYHGTLAELRAMAPDPGHLLDTDDNERAAALADGHDVRVEAGDALMVTGPADRVSAYVAHLVRHDVQLRAFTPTRTPLEELFFMLTDDAREVTA